MGGAPSAHHARAAAGASDWTADRTVGSRLGTPAAAVSRAGA